LFSVAFTSNLLEELPPNLFESNQFISSIHFDQNLLTTARTYGAEFVELSSNKLSQLKLDARTKILHANNNFLSSFDCADDLTSYERVFTNNNSLTNFKCVKDMENIYDLQISDNKLLRPNPGIFNKLVKMKDLRLYNQPKFDKVAAKVFAPMKKLAVLRVDRFVDYRNLKQLFPELFMIALSTKTWNCSYTTQVSKALARQRIRMNYNDLSDKKICNVVQTFT
jgi:neutral trehalase